MSIFFVFRLFSKLAQCVCSVQFQGTGIHFSGQIAKFFTCTPMLFPRTKMVVAPASKFKSFNLTAIHLNFRGGALSAGMDPTGRFINYGAQ